MTMGSDGSAYAELGGESGWRPTQEVDVVDTTGAGDAFFAGVAVGLTSGKTLAESCEIGTRIASAVIVTGENVCPPLSAEELGLEVE